MLDAGLQPPPLRALAFLLPQFHPIPENDAFWGAGFTEWRNVVQARPRFRGHDQPQLPADLGFYDLRLGETQHAQAALARQAGLSGFCWYHYWFNGRRILHQPLDTMLADRSYDFPFMLCWANENWTRAWDGGDRDILLAQTQSQDDTIAHARHLAPVLADPRYIRIHGRPVFAVYATDTMEDPLAWSDLFRETLLPFGIEPYLLRVERALDRDTRPPRSFGFDAAIDFQPFSRSLRALDFARPSLAVKVARRIDRLTRPIWPRDLHRDMAALVKTDLAQSAPPYLRFPGTCPSWDNSARRPARKAIIFRNTSPALFEQWTARKIQAFLPPSPDENLLFINAWNEWAEGNHLEPCMRYGHAWLHATHRALTRSVATAATLV